MLLQRRQIVITLGKQIDIEDPVAVKYASTSFLSITCMFISSNVTIYRTIPIQRYQRRLVNA
jgi:hypothetical protein